MIAPGVVRCELHPRPLPPTARTLPDLTPLPGKQTGAEVTKLVGLMQRLLAPGRLPLGPRADAGDAGALPHRGDLRGASTRSPRGDVDDHCEELGDLLLQIVFQSELRFAEGAFGIDDVARGIVTKLVRRHPHVFGDVPWRKDADDVLANWAKLKAAEKAEKGKHGALDGIPKSAPALLRAQRVGEKAGAVGLRLARRQGPAREDRRGAGASSTRPSARGDRGRDAAASWATCLLAIVNLARKLGLDAEQALRDSTDRFARRFRHIEEALRAAGPRRRRRRRRRAGPPVGRREASLEEALKADVSRASR